MAHGMRRGVDIGAANQLAAKGLAVRQAKADARARGLAAPVAALRAAGITSQAGLARALNNAGVTTPRGKRWRGSQVAALLRRLEAIS